ncbi:rhodanese-like domain-containing protein [Alphaproteobacteria bacterium]|nr:rhodanese-like domain-containing protein [Alphaproteobacteria bacterium]
MFRIKTIIVCCLIFFLNIQLINANPLVDNEWLKDKVCTEGFKIIEVHRSKKEYELSHIPCSVFTNFYTSGWRETRNKIPLLMPSINNLEKLIGSLGVLDSDHVIIVAPGTGKYDAAETTAIYFTFKYLGHKKLSILNGGLKGWKEDWDSETETGFIFPEVKFYKAEVNQNIIASKEDVLKIINKTGYLIDSRPSDMFVGINTSFPALRTGTIPNAVNIPNAWLLKNNSLYFQEKENIQKIFEHSDISKQDGQISFCNAGLESSLTWFVISEILGYPNHRLYEASLAEWSGDISLPMIDKINFSKNTDNEKVINSFSMKPPK